MALPNPGMTFSPFAILTAEEMNDIVENIEALSDGSGQNDKSVDNTKLNLPWQTFTHSTVGFAAGSTVIARYARIGDIVHIYYNATGTSNSTLWNFQVPFPAVNDIQLTNFRCRSGGSIQSTPGLMSISVSAGSPSQCDLFTSPTAGTWANTGNKQIFGLTFSYEVATL